MKKVLFLMIVSLFSMNLSAQVMRAEELEKYAKENYGDKWVDAAENLGSSLVLDKNQSLTYEQIINCGEQTKEQLYITLNHWFAESFNDANSVIKLNDKDAGVIIAKGFVGGIAQHIGGMTAYNVNIHPVIKVDIKDKKIRVTYTLQYYEVEQNIGGGWMGAFSAGTTGQPADTTKKTSSKALIMAHAYSNVIMDKIEEAVKNGLVGNENDDW
jgi:hypothetical protein